MKMAMRKHRGPHMNCATRCISTSRIREGERKGEKEKHEIWRRERKIGKENRRGRKRRTAVIVSMHRTKGSEVKYLESLRAYSFHN